MVRDKVLENVLINTENECSVKYISKKTRLCEITVRSSVKKLIEKGLLVIVNGWEHKIYLTTAGEEQKAELLNKYFNYDNFRTQRGIAL